MILITGATGTVGTQLVRALRAAGTDVRALVRDESRAPADWDAGVQLAVADLTDPASLAAAIEGVEAIYLLAPVHPEMAQHERDVIDAAVRTVGQPRIVLQAAAGVERRLADVPFVAAHVAGFDHLRESGLPWTVLAPNGFMQNFLGMATSLRAGAMALPAGESAVSYVDTRDVADVAATVLTTGGHDGMVYQLTGPESLTHGEIAKRIGAVVGRDVAYDAIAPERARAAMLSAGLDSWRADGLIELYGMYAAGDAAAVSDDVPRLLGRPARSLHEFLTEHAAALR
jgi:uncharacterized protein YbjT (DUF2867 family)